MATRKDFIDLIQKNSIEKPFINYFSMETKGFSISWKEFQFLTRRIDNLLLQSLGETFEFVGIHLNDYLWLPCLLTSIWKLGKACACVGNQYSQDCNLNFLNALNVKYLIGDNGIPCLTGDLVDTFQINDMRFNVWMIKSDSVAGISNKPFDICYGIMTSGSTGSPKIVQVPWSCILPNVYELVHLLSVNENDNVYLSSPYTFDPFFVELFMVFIAGCTLTIVSPQLKMSSEALLKIFFEDQDYLYCNTARMDAESADENGCICKTNPILKSSITILQMTPSIFKRWRFNMIKDTVLSGNSSLRVLLLGGENFPTDLLKLRSNSNKTQIYNIYGITEISCWAFLSNVTDSDSDISLGSPLKDIVYEVSKNNELIVGSKKRRCFIDDEINVETDEIVYRKTGDIVTIKNSKIYYVSRTNQIVKKFGIKINLEKIENTFLKTHKHMHDSFCVFSQTDMKLALFYSNHELIDDYQVKNWQKKKDLPLTSIEIPDYIIEIQKPPLNSNGKCDKGSLLKLFKEILNRKERDGNVEIIFDRIWAEIIGNKNFVISGGDSVKALQMVTRLEEAGLELSKDFLPALLTHGDYEKCLGHVKESREPKCKKIKLQHERIYKLSILWTFDTKKCVDAPPTLFDMNGEVHAVVGSHSSRLSSLKVDTGQENWTINLTDRIESGFSVNKSSTFGVIGCYDQHVYCLSTLNGNILWKYKTGGMIKSTPCLSSDEETVFVASYDTFLYRLQCRDGKLVKRLKLSDGGIYSSGVVSDEIGAFFIATLDGTCISLNQISCEITWKQRLGSPVFASPVLVIGDSTAISVIFTEVIGQLHCFNARTGEEVWRYKCNGCIYSTPIFSPELDFLFFPCYDSHLYCLKFSDEPSIKWKAELDSPGFSKPCFISINQTLLTSVASTKGCLYLFHADSGSNLGQIILNGEVFSSPKFCLDSLVVGCRDNNLYCIKMAT